MTILTRNQIDGFESLNNLDRLFQTHACNIIASHHAQASEIEMLEKRVKELEDYLTKIRSKYPPVTLEKL